MDTELLVAEQIVRLFRGGPVVVWELVPTGAPGRATDVTIRGPDGRPVVYARRAA
jgi:hypothetical protein